VHMDMADAVNVMLHQQRSAAGGSPDPRHCSPWQPPEYQVGLHLCAVPFVSTILSLCLSYVLLRCFALIPATGGSPNPHHCSPWQPPEYQVSLYHCAMPFLETFFLSVPVPCHIALLCA
jgi:hypothetical protein